MSRLQMSPQRRKVVALAGAIAGVSGLTGTLTRGHPYIADGILGLTALGLIYVIREMFRLKRAEPYRKLET